MALMRQGISVFSGHTAYDSCGLGINHQWAERLQLHSVQPLRPDAQDASIGGGRWGQLDRETTLQAFTQTACAVCGAESGHYVGAPEKVIRTVAVGCGSGSSFIETAVEHGCDVLVTGEASFHACLEAEAKELGLVLTGHYGSERFAMDWLAEWIQQQIPEVEAWASRRESDPIRQLPTQPRG
jgi:putative NIF3 family GTP cyclohydrolase 1 type 2